MKILSALHDPRNERYAIYYSIILLAMIIVTTLLVTGIYESNPIEGTMMFFEGFVALFMLTRHKKVSHSFTNHLTKTDTKLTKFFISMSKSLFRSRS